MTRKKNSAITARKLSCYHNDVLYRPPVYTKHITYLDHEYSVLQLNQCPAERGKLLTFLSIILPFRSACLVIIIARKSYTNTDTKLDNSTLETLDPADTKTYNIASRPDDGDTGCVASSLSKDAQSMTLEVRNVRVIVTWTRHQWLKTGCQGQIRCISGCGLCL